MSLHRYLASTSSSCDECGARIATGADVWHDSADLAAVTLCGSCGERGATVPAPYYSDDAVTLHHGDCLDVLRSLPDCSVDSVVTDPPYGIAFMGKAWDQPGQYGSRRAAPGPNLVRGDADAALEAGRYDLSPHAMLSFQQWCTQWSIECLRILKPGGHMVAFGGSRTWHRLASAVEDAGFEIRDSIAWLYGSGFPKSLDVSKAIDKAAGAERQVVGSKLDRPGYHLNAHDSGGAALGAGLSSSTASTRLKSSQITAAATADAEQWQGWGTALKPAFEPIVVGRKPLAGTVAANVLEHGTGALNIDATRTAHASAADLATSQAKNRHADFGSGPRENQVYGADGRDRGEGGNYDGSAGRWPTNVLLDNTQAADLDRQNGVSTSRIGKPRGAAAGDGWGMTATGAEHADSGGPSRFFPTFHYEAKAPTSERPRLWRHACECEHDEPMRPKGTCPTCGTAGELVAHPTVKPLDLMRWLVRLITPPGGTVLEPFAGSGTTAEACVVENLRCIAIEREADYLPLIVGRLSKPIQVGLDFGGDA